MKKESNFRTTDIFLAAILHYFNYSHSSEKIDNSVIFTFYGDPLKGDPTDISENYKAGKVRVSNMANFKKYLDEIRGEVYDLVKGKDAKPTA